MSITARNAFCPLRQFNYFIKKYLKIWVNLTYIVSVIVTTKPTLVLELGFYIAEKLSYL